MAVENPTLIVAGTFASDLVAPMVYGPLVACLGAEVVTLKHAGVAHTRESAEKVADRAEMMMSRYGRRPILLGHSQGGLAAVVAAQRWPYLFRGVITLGAPLAGVKACGTWMPMPSLRCMSSRSRLVADLSLPDGMRVITVAGGRDAVVPTHSALRPDAECYIVDAGHVGMVLDPRSVSFIQSLVDNWDRVAYYEAISA